MNKSNIGLEDLIMDIELENEKPGQDSKEELDELIDFIGFEKGKLYFSSKEIPWIWGDVDNPDWLGSPVETKNGDFEYIVETEPGETFCYVGTKLLCSKNFETEEYGWIWAIEAIVRDKVAYFPIPIGQMDDDIKNEFKEILGFQKIS